jgi:hypothetical protein
VEIPWTHRSIAAVLSAFSSAPPALRDPFPHIFDIAGKFIFKIRIHLKISPVFFADLDISFKTVSGWRQHVLPEYFAFLSRVLFFWIRYKRGFDQDAWALRPTST